MPLRLHSRYFRAFYPVSSRRGILPAAPPSDKKHPLRPDCAAPVRLAETEEAPALVIETNAAVRDPVRRDRLSIENPPRGGLRQIERRQRIERAVGRDERRAPACPAERLHLIEPQHRLTFER